MTGVAFARSVPIARRQLGAKRGRTLAGIAGIGVALLLILALKAIFAGMETRLTAYIDSTGADVIVAQAGVETMHMTQSALPATAAAAVRGVVGVRTTEAILYKSAFVESRGDRSGIVAVVGGGPIPRLVAGRAPAAGEIVVDRALSDRLAVEVGDRVRVLGASLRVSGEITGTAAITGSFAFVRRETLGSILHANGVASYLLVRAEAGVLAATVARRIDERVPGVTASTRRDFATSERSVVGDMSTDIVRGMILVGFVIGVAVAALVAYSQTLTQLRDYGVLRALGLRARAALMLVVVQVAAIVVSGFAVALALVVLLAFVVPELSPTLVLTLRLPDVVEAALVAGAVAVGAALVPVARVVRVDPSTVYRSAS
jgi:putative ABC transport system permease protein